MATSDVEICNRALSNIGSTKLINALDQAGSLEATQCNLWYARLRDEILRERVWKFATLRAALAIVAGETRSDWAFVYALPANCLKVRGLVLPGQRSPYLILGAPYTYFAGATSQGAFANALKSIPMDIEARVDDQGNVIGKLLLCDVEDAELLYTVRCTNPQVFDPDFESALEAYLSSKLAYALPKKADLAKHFMDAYELATRKAGAASVNEQTADPEGPSSLESSRY